MRNLLISLVAVCFVASLAEAQVPARYSVYVPRTLSAGTIMTARSLASLADTTQPIDIRGCTFVGMNMQSTADSLGVLLYVQGSRDGTNWSNLVLVDSVKHAVSTVAGVGAVTVPDRWYAFPWLRFNVRVSVDGPFGAAPAGTVRFEVIRRFN